MRRFIVVTLLGLTLASFLGAKPEKPAPAGSKEPPADTTVLVIHGGAGVLTDDEMKREGLRDHFERALADALRAGYQVLQEDDTTSVDAVETAIRVMEDSELFNAGRGAAFNSDGRVELDAAIMEGKMEGEGAGKNDPRKRAGAVAGVAHVKNPISAARAVMEDDGSRHVMLIGEGAEWFALGEANRKRYAIEKVSNVYFWTDRRLRQIQEAMAKEEAEPTKTTGRPNQEGADKRFGTVGAVALDAHENLAAGTSTGGTTNKLPGRVGAVPLIGAGTYADDRACGISCTGTGEVFIRHAVAYDVVARMLYAQSSVADAVRETIGGLPDEEGGVGGLIALDRHGKHALGMSPKSVGMYRGYVTKQGRIFVAVFADEPEKCIE